MTPTRWFLAALLLMAAACSEGPTDVVVSDVVTSIPWGPPETARYRLLKDDDVIGTAELTLLTRGEVLILNQIFEIPDEGISDHVAVEVNPMTLHPAAVRRVIDGPEGKRECEARYSAGSVTVEQRSDQDERTDQESVPDNVYDTWADLFLWRTLAFGEGLEFKYADMLSCSLAKPELLSVVLKVREVETISVPAGEFETWRLEIRSGGRTQHAWYSDDADHSLVRYDNGELVFELESRE